jgi:CRISP-associated protein Cas1
MRDDDNAPKSIIPAPRSASYRICPVCTRGFGGRPPQQRCCSTRCAAEWMRKKRPDKKPPRFDVIEGRLPASADTYDIDAQDAAWGERGAYWESVAVSLAPRDRSVSLSVTGHGALMRVDGNSLIVRHGFTHYPEQRIEQRYIPRDRSLPERIVLLACDGSVTISALDWLARQKVHIVLLDRRGNLAASFVPSFAPVDRADIRKRLDNLDQSTAISLARYLIAKKLDGQIATADRFQASVTRAMTLTQLRNERTSLDLAPTIEDIRMVEARAAVAYFKLWTRSAMRWKGLGRRPVPVEWFSIGLRGSAIGDSNRHATHPANAILNYTYGCLQSQVSIACAASGLDPAAGVIHTRRRGRPALAFDLMEPLRPVVDAVVLNFIQSQVFTRADFPVGSDGVVRLHPQLARVVSSLGIATEAVTGVVANFIAEVTKCGEADAYRS